MAPHNPKELSDLFRNWYFVLKSDAEALREVRHLLLGLAVCLVLFSAGNTLFVKPLTKAVAQKNARLTELRKQERGLAGQVLTSEQQALRKEEQSLEEQNAILALQEGFYKEQWQMWGNAERFTKIIFTLLPRAPVNLENNVRQMNQLEKRSKDGFAVHAVNMAGEATFQELYRYLAYVEGQPEVSVIEDLAIERLPVESYQRPAKLRFSVVMGRLAYEGPPPEGAAPQPAAQAPAQTPAASPAPAPAPAGEKKP